MVTAIYNKDKGLRWFICSTRYNITSDEFRAAVKETHGNNEHAQDYLALIDFVESHPAIKRMQQKGGGDVEAR